MRNVMWFGLKALLVPALLPAAAIVPGSGWSAERPARAVLMVEPDTVQATLRTVPERPRQGAIFRIELRLVDAATSVWGKFAGEPLHFVPSENGTAWTALAAVPIDSSGSITTDVNVARDDAVELKTLTVRIAPGEYASEELSVAPRYGRRPAKALAARIARESRQALQVARASHDTPRLWDGEFQRPRPGRITSGYGRARTFNGRVSSRHMGTDFAGAPGAPVHAIQRGVVRIVDEFYYGGNVVYVDHGAGLTTAYLHLSSTAVAVGDTVERGQLIGGVGASGRVTGPHLHLIVRYGAVTVDPMSLLELTAREERAGAR